MVVIDRTRLVLARVPPNLQRAELRDAVLHVVKWAGENVRLAVPQIGAHVFVTAPDYIAAKALHQVDQGRARLGGRGAGLGLDQCWKASTVAIHGKRPMIFSRCVRRARLASGAA